MKSAIIKRSIIINGHKTSISLEDEFWNSFRDIAKERDEGIGELLASIDASRTHANLSSAIRLFVLDYYRNRFETRKPLQQINGSPRTTPVQDQTLATADADEHPLS